MKTISRSKAADGGRLDEIYSKGTAQQLWEAWDEKQRKHFLIDHSDMFTELVSDDYKKSWDAYAVLTFDTLPKSIQKEIIIHHAMGMYEHGGKAGGDIEVSELSSVLGMRKEAVQEWLDKNELSKEDALKILTGLGRKHIQVGDVTTAMMGYENNKFNKEIIEYVNTDRAYEMAGGGGVENLEKELHKLQRDLNSSRLQTYIKGDNSEEEKARQRERAVKLARFNEVLRLLREKDKSSAGSMEGGGKIAYTGNIVEIIKPAHHYFGKKGLVVDFIPGSKSIEVRFSPPEISEGYDEEFFKQKDVKIISERRRAIPSVSTIMQKDGGPIENQYKGKTNEQIWNVWDLHQRRNFLDDHFDKTGIKITGHQQHEFFGKEYKDLPDGIKDELYKHIWNGQYSDGARVGIGVFNGKEFWRVTANAVDGIGIYPKHLYSKEQAEKLFTERYIDKSYEHGGIIQQREDVISRILSDESFLPNLSIKQQLKFIDKVAEAKSKGEIEEIVSKSEKLKRMDGGGRLSPAKQKIKSRIDKLTSLVEKMAGKTKDVVQKKINQLQKQLDYNPTAKERAQANQGKFALDVETKHSKHIYKKLWSMGILPRTHKLNGTTSIIVSSQNNLNKAYKVYSDVAGKVPPLSKISRKL